MHRLTALLLSLLLAAIALPVTAGPDEEKLGKSQGYPAGVGASWFFDESVRVGSFTRQGELSGLFQGKANVLAASDAPMILRRDGKDDLARFGDAVMRDGVVEAAKVITEREAPQGTRFSYASAETEILAGVLQGATGMNLSEYLSTRLWQAIGAETSALWRADKRGLERAAGNFNATLSDFGRLGVVLANDGVRPAAGSARPAGSELAAG